MTRRGIAIVSLHAAVVAVLMAIVYVTLLAPEKNERLFDVSLSPKPSRLAPPPRGEREGARGEDRQQPKPDRLRSGERPATPVGPTATGLDAAQPPIATVPPAGVTEGPADDQYDDAVSRMLDRL
jgi:hypothetical protein